jgi:hypothetical protein
MTNTKKCDTCAHAAAMLATVCQCSGTLDAEGNCMQHSPGSPAPGDVDAKLRNVREALAEAEEITRYSWGDDARVQRAARAIEKALAILDGGKGDEGGT